MALQHCRVQCAGFTRRIITGREVILSVQAALVLYGVAKVGNYFTTLGLAYTGRPKHVYTVRGNLLRMLSL